MTSVLTCTNMFRRRFLQFAGVTMYAGLMNLRPPRLFPIKPIVESTDNRTNANANQLYQTNANSIKDPMEIEFIT